MGNVCCDKPPQTETKMVTGDESEEEDDDIELDEEPPPQKNVGRGGARQSVSAEAYGAWNQQAVFKPPVIHKTPEQRRRIVAALEKSWIFAGLEGNDLEQVIDAFEEEQKQVGEEVIKQFDTDAAHLYMIEKGNFSVWKKTSPTESGNGKQVFAYAGEGVFGELALLYNCPRAATVISDSPGTMWKLGRETFNTLVKTSAQNKRKQTEEFLERVPILESLDRHERAAICDAIKTKKYKNGDYIIRQGEDGNEIFILADGTADAIKDGATVCSYTSAQYFGELALLRGDKRAADVRATSDVRALALDRQAFRRLLGPLEGILWERARATYDRVAAG